MASVPHFTEIEYVLDDKYVLADIEADWNNRVLLKFNVNDWIILEMNKMDNVPLTRSGAKRIAKYIHTVYNGNLNL